MKNSQIVLTLQCVTAIINSQEARKAAPPKTGYAMKKNHARLLPLWNTIHKKEEDLEEALKETQKQIAENTDLTSEQRVQQLEEMHNLFQSDKTAMFEEEQEVQLHKVPMETSDVLQQYLAGIFLEPLYDHLTEEEIKK